MLGLAPHRRAWRCLYNIPLNCYDESQYSLRTKQRTVIRRSKYLHIHVSQTVTTIPGVVVALDLMWWIWEVLYFQTEYIKEKKKEKKKIFLY